MRPTFPCALFIASFLLPACSTANDSYEETIQINSHLGACHAMVESLCLMRRPAATEPWRLQYEHIAGFTYQWGKIYTVKVRITRWKNPPADASSVQYSLVKVISSSDVSRAQAFQISFRNVGQAITTINKDTKSFVGHPTAFACQQSQCEQLDQMAAQGAAATLTFDHTGSAASPLRLLSVSPAQFAIH